MRIDGSTRAQTVLDDESGGILLRRLHPRIANYNDLVIFLMKCNMDVKFIGSGEAAKALIYYVTDYITKASLPAHVGLAALSYAIQKTNDQFPHMEEVRDLPRPRGALTMAVNRMMSHQEISHQQVMSYLIGGGDVYTSHQFRVLNWGSYDRMFKKAPDDANTGDVREDTFLLRIGAGTITSQNQVQDYVYRSTSEPFNSLCLYELVGNTETMTIERDRNRRRGARELVASLEGAEHSVSARASRALPRGHFCSPEHTQFETHMMRMRRVPLVPVVLGDRIPRSDRGEEEKLEWARMMLILFVPWRRPTDLRQPDESWIEAFERQKSQISGLHEGVIANMNVLSECRDVRDSLQAMRRAEALAIIKENAVSGDTAVHTGLGEDNAVNDFDLFNADGMVDMYDNITDLKASEEAIDASVGAASRELLDVCYNESNQQEAQNEIRGGVGTVRYRTDEDGLVIKQHGTLMRKLRSVRRPQYPEERARDSARPRKRRRLNEIVESVTVTELRSSCGSGDDGGAQDMSTLIEDIVDEFHFRSNEEQEKAFRIVANHIDAGDGQLLMYLAGVGGTGKTHVVKAIVELFERLGR
ncbi:hypothetical protein FKP32DRAFT_1556647, partial [Trametes sanguinea]